MGERGVPRGKLHPESLRSRAKEAEMAEGAGWCLKGLKTHLK